MKIRNFAEIEWKANLAVKSISGGCRDLKMPRGPALRAMFKISATHHVHQSRVMILNGYGWWRAALVCETLVFSFQHVACRDGIPQTAV